MSERAPARPRMPISMDANKYLQTVILYSIFFFGEKQTNEFRLKQ